MKKSTVLLFFALLCNTAWTQNTPNIEWSRSIGLDGFNHRVVKIKGGYITSVTKFNIIGWPDAVVTKFNENGIMKWQRTIAGAGWDEISSIKPTSDGGFVVVGVTESGDGDFTGSPNPNIYDWTWVAKLDRHGRTQWQRYVQGGRGLDIVQTQEGGYAAVGINQLTTNQGTNINMYVLKMNRNGIVQWTRSFGGMDSMEVGRSIITVKGGLVICGDLYLPNNGIGGDFYLTKMNLSGDIVWAHAYGGTQNDEGHIVKSTPDGGYLITGITFSGDGDLADGNPDPLGDCWTLKTDSRGDVQWKSRFGGNRTDVGVSLITFGDGSCIVAGMSDSNDSTLQSKGMYDLMLVKYRPNGVIEWNRTVGGTGNEVSDLWIEKSNGDDFVLFAPSGSTDFDFTRTGTHLMKFSQPTIHHMRLSHDAETLSPYPNPCDAGFSLHLDEESTVQVFDMNGRMVHPALTNISGLVEINTQLMENGMYIVRVISGENVHSKRIVVSH